MAVQTFDLAKKALVYRALCLLSLALGMVAVPAFGQTTPAPAPAPAPSDRLKDVYQIYSLLMPGQVFVDMDAGNPWAISDTTINEDDVNPRFAPDATLQPPPDNPRGFAEALSDYRQRKKDRMPLTRRFALSRPYVLLKPNEVTQMKAARTSLNADSGMQSKYGGYLGITYFSEVYFNIAQNAALVYILDWCGNLCSQSQWVYIEKQGGVWVMRSGKAAPQS